jgi:hypothetical protein
MRSLPLLQSVVFARGCCTIIYVFHGTGTVSGLLRVRHECTFGSRGIVPLFIIHCTNRLYLRSFYPLGKRSHIRVGADKSLARPGRNKATATKLWIYSTYSPRSPIHFLPRCTNFSKTLKIIQKFVRPTRSARQQRPPCGTKNDNLSILFFSPGKRW